MECTYFADNNKNVAFGHLSELTYYASIANLAESSYFMYYESFILCNLYILPFFAKKHLTDVYTARKVTVSMSFIGPHKEGGVISKLFPRDWQVVRWQFGCVQ